MTLGKFVLNESYDVKVKIIQTKKFRKIFIDLFQIDFEDLHSKIHQ